MRKYTSLLAVGFLALCLGLTIPMQMASSKNSDQGGLVPVKQLAQYQSEMERLQLEKDGAIEQLRNYEERIAQIEKENSEDDTILAGLMEDLDRYKMLAGLLDVYGPGLMITLDDPPVLPGADYDKYSEIMTHFELLLGLVNRLKEAGAEAIAVNGHRVVTLTEIVLAGDNVNVNSKPTAPPYKITAIGDPDTLESAITIKYGIISVIKDYSIQVNIEKKDELVINRYNGVTNFRFAQPVSADRTSNG
ncbi:MAG: DUF881 domain-containing protein [Clostridiales Family XIII bacterium]|jgi:uncharacterized protein YlxW (UPF0749 family)|nr:DUF881 domain-containing protein [Clostridiales Family XIII bacterium]